jgi:tetratricopeptide (TPR) repeat protein
MTPARTLATAAVLLSLALAAPARAEEVSAAEHAKRAQVAYALQDWKTAIAEYQSAYRVEQKPEYLWSLGQTQRQSGDCASAIKSYKAFARSATNANQVTSATLNINKCEAELAKQEQERAAAAAKAEPATAQAGSATAQAATAAGGAPAASAAQPAAEPQPPRRWYADGWGHALVIGGTVAAATGAVLLVQAGGEADSASYDATVSRVAGVGGLLVGGTLIANGVLRYLMIDGTTPRVSASLGPRTAGLGISGRF